MNYDMIIETGVYRATSLKVAKAAKDAKNNHRDISFAFMKKGDTKLL